MQHNILIIGGPTASGKSGLALTLAKENDAVIINADSMQVYRELPIITAQPTSEEQKTAPHRLYGYISVVELYSVGRWAEDAAYEINTILAEGKQPILVGGTGMYIKSLMHGMAEIPDIDEDIRKETRTLIEEIGNEAFHQQLSERDPIMGEKLKPGDTQRMLRAWEVLEQTGESIHTWQQKPVKIYFEPEQFSGVFLNPRREELREKINTRFEQMLNNGALEEIRKLDQLLSTNVILSEQSESKDLLNSQEILRYAQNDNAYLPALKAHGVPELLAYLRDEMTLEAAIEQAQTHTRQYAKRQVTWWRHQLPELKEVENTETIDYYLS